MRIGWGTVLKQYLHRSAAKFRLGIALTDQGVHVSVLESRSGTWVWIEQHFVDVVDWQNKLAQWVEKQGYKFAHCNVVLPGESYQIIQIDRPAVEDDEMDAALNWAIKDILPSEEPTQLDYFDLPAQAAGANKVSVVVSAKKELNELVSVLFKAQLQPSIITVKEMVLAQLITQPADGQVLIYQQAGHELFLSIYKDGKIYFTRRLKGYELLSSLSIDELQNGMLEALATEIQRSMDYFDSQLHQAALRKATLILDTDFEEEIAQALKNLLFIEVQNSEPFVSAVDGLHLRHAYTESLCAALLNKTQTSSNKKGDAV